MVRTASAILGVRASAKVLLSFVDNVVRATDNSSSRSASLSILNVSKNYRIVS